MTSNLTPKERISQFVEDKRNRSATATTFFNQAKLDDKLEERGAIYPGEDEVVHYPRQPDTSPWSQPQPGVEPPTNEDINAQIPCGEYHEVQASIERERERVKDQGDDDKTE